VGTVGEVIVFSTLYDGPRRASFGNSSMGIRLSPKGQEKVVSGEAGWLTASIDMKGSCCVQLGRTAFAMFESVAISE